MSRRVFFIDLKNDPGLIAEYERRHAPGAVWTEIIEDIRRQGFADMQIWRAVDRLVMIAEIPDDTSEANRTPDQNALVQRWEAEMDEYQLRLSTSPTDTKWTLAHLIFDLNDQ